MLVLSRKVGERILIGDKITITVVKIGHGGVRVGAVKALSRYSWPGNIRELENIVFNVLNINEGRQVRAEDLGLKFHDVKSSVDKRSLRDVIEQAERNHIFSVCGESDTLREAAQKLGITAPNLIRILKKYDLSSDQIVGIRSGVRSK